MKKSLLIVSLLIASGSQKMNLGAYISQEEHQEREIARLEYEKTKQEYENNLLFEDAVELIKKYESWHGPEHYPYIGYGHLIIPEDNLELPITEQQADSILRVDLRKKMDHFMGPFKTQLLLGMLSYNVGQYKLINEDGTPKSNVAKMLLDSCYFDVTEAKSEYTSWRKWNGKVIKSIESRRTEEFELIYPKS